MIADLGGEVVSLHRDRIGGLQLPADLSPGLMREMSASEMRALMSGAETNNNTNTNTDTKNQESNGSIEIEI